ncbi:MAG: AraC family transcriptional regulator [Sporomusaceae bacterium]|jgi:AraC-like DNA-binding protein|nr:AraC family transcriptional regulator [Sporomusaceae bacterium]
MANSSNIRQKKRVAQQENRITFYQYLDTEIVVGRCAHLFPPHIHKSFCIGKITCGSAVLLFNDQEAFLRPGDHYVIPPYTPHSLGPVNNEEFGYVVYCFKNFCGQTILSSIVADAQKYLEKTPAGFDLDVLADTLQVSKYHFCRQFKKELGISPYQFYLGEKVKKIRQGLHLNLSLSDLTFDLGFFDQSHLCHTFKKHMGISPRQYVLSQHHFLK